MQPFTVSSPAPVSPITVTFSLDRELALNFLSDLRAVHDPTPFTTDLVRALEAELTNPEAGR